MAVGGSARGQMRPHSSKSPPFLLVGLFVVIAILAFNYWNASTKYAFSRKQVIRLSDKYQELNLKKQGIEKRNLDLADELNERKTEVMKCIAKNSADTTNCENRIRREKDEVLTQLSAVKLDNDNMRQKEIENQESLKQCQTHLDNAKEATERAKSEMEMQCQEKLTKAAQNQSEGARSLWLPRTGAFAGL
ncbi:hypothetical protein NP493_310g00013 [Ridgeia piscesae]|uniref:Uncharacterized protein n=1 Tax=Ridgeia piscesae TaxID=27915 RepID=A0AAD9L5H2_RIDPI|nr:hypothetical protein NP493_310g00013 [Ridgeia piscesae]